MYTIWKAFTFAAAHRLDGLPDDHPCARMHGHNYTVEVELQSDELDDIGFVLDYRVLDYFKRAIDQEYDHRVLNDIVDFNPTAELLAVHFFAKAQRLFGTDVTAVRVRETDKTCAEYRDFTVVLEKRVPGSKVMEQIKKSGVSK